MVVVFFFFQAEDGIRDLVRSRGLGDVYKRQRARCSLTGACRVESLVVFLSELAHDTAEVGAIEACLLYTSDAADERARGDLGGGRSLKKKKKKA